MAKQEETRTDLPTLEDFTESSLLDVVSEEEESEEQEEQEEESEEEESQEEEEEAPKKKSKKPIDEESPLGDDDEEEEDEDPEEEDEDDSKKKKPKADASEEEEAGSFWDDVEKITGVHVEVDYGDVDPESDEGAALRESALVNMVESSVHEHLKKTYPKAYKALELEAAGGDISQLITPDYVDYTKITLDPDNESQHRKILMDYYMDVKNLPEAKAKRMVEADEDDEAEDSLFKAATEALQERAATQKEKEDRLLAEQKKQADLQRQRDTQLIDYVKSVTDRGEIGKFKLPAQERDKFYEFFTNTIQRHPEGGYMFAVPLSNDNFGQMMEQAYFAFKGGKLDALVQRRATTESTKRLKRNLKRNDKKVSPSTSSTQEQEDKRRDGKKLPTMDHFAAE